MDVPVDRYSRALTLRKSKLRIGLPRHPFFDEVDPEIAAAVTVAIDVLRPWAESVRDMELPPLPALPFVMGTEAYAYEQATEWHRRKPTLPS